MTGRFRRWNRGRRNRPPHLRHKGPPWWTRTPTPCSDNSRFFHGCVRRFPRYKMVVVGAYRNHSRVGATLYGRTGAQIATHPPDGQALVGTLRGTLREPAQVRGRARIIQASLMTLTLPSRKSKTMRVFFRCTLFTSPSPPTS